MNYDAWIRCYPTRQYVYSENNKMQNMTDTYLKMY